MVLVIVTNGGLVVHLVCVSGAWFLPLGIGRGRSWLLGTSCHSDGQTAPWNGLWSPPARQAALSLRPASSVPELSISAWLEWLYSGLGSRNIWLGPTLLLIIVVGLGTEHRRAALLGALCSTQWVHSCHRPGTPRSEYPIFPLWLTFSLGWAWQPVSC